MYTFTIILTITIWGLFLERQYILLFEIILTYMHAICVKLYDAMIVHESSLQHSVVFGITTY